MIFNEEFYEEETRCGYTVSKEIKKVWVVELDMDQELIRVCQKHGLHVFMDTWTLLGVVRHKGLFLGTMIWTFVCSARIMTMEII